MEQVQDFTPTPGSLSTCMFHTGIDPENGKAVFVPRSDKEKGLQKALLLWHQPAERDKVHEALRELGREDLVAVLLGAVPGRGRDEKKAAEAVGQCDRRGIKQHTATKKRH